MKGEWRVSIAEGGWRWVKEQRWRLGRQREVVELVAQQLGQLVGVELEALGEEEPEG